MRTRILLKNRWDQALIWRPAVGMNSSRICLSSAFVLSFNCFSTLIDSRMCGYLVLICSRKSLSNLPISLVWTLSKKPLTPAYRTQTCSWASIGTYCFCFKSSVSFSPLFSKCWVEASRSEPNWAKAATSLYWASSSLREPATYFMALIWAADPTLDTDKPTLIAGLIPL